MAIAVHVKRIDNGFLVHVGSEEKAFTGGEREALADMLVYVGEFFGEPYDKFGGENIRVSFDRKGPKAD